MSTQLYKITYDKTSTPSFVVVESDSERFVDGHLGGFSVEACIILPGANPKVVQLQAHPMRYKYSLINPTIEFFIDCALQWSINFIERQYPSVTAAARPLTAEPATVEDLYKAQFLDLGYDFETAALACNEHSLNDMLRQIGRAPKMESNEATNT